LPQALDQLVKTGAPLLVCEIDHLATEAAGDLVFADKLSMRCMNEVHACLAAVEARHGETEWARVDHSPTLSRL
jgi:hypothetical protein